MRRCIAIILATFVLVSVLATGLGGATTTTTVQYQETTTGISMGPIAESEIENLETYERRSKVLVSIRQARSLYLPAQTATGISSLALSQSPQGRQTVEGRSFSTGETSGEIIIADNFEVETEGDRISFDELRNNPQQYDHELVRFDAGAAMGSIAAKPTSGVSSQQTAAYLTEPGNLSSDLFQQSPGELASTISLTDSNSSVERSSSSVPQFPEYGITGQSFSQQFWGEGEATVDAAVVPVYRQFGDGDSIQTGRQLIIVDVNYDSQILDSPAEIRSGSYEGETVTVSSDIVGSSTSTQEYLTEVASCGDKTVSVPMSPPVCVPVTHDIVVHSGVLVDGTSPGEVPIVYAGISNKIQNSPTEVKTGRYRITGEVVSTSEIDSSLEGSYALRVFDMGVSVMRISRVAFRRMPTNSSNGSKRNSI